MFPNTLTDVHLRIAKLIMMPSFESACAGHHAAVMSEEGASGVYVNPHGVVHDMITVGRVLPNALALEGGPETVHSWFPAGVHNRSPLTVV